MSVESCIPNCFDFALLCSSIGLKNIGSKLIYSETRPKSITAWSCVFSRACQRFLVFRIAFLLLYCLKTLLTFVVTTLVWFSDNTYISSKSYFSMHAFILSARAQLLKGEAEHGKNDFRKALSCYTEGIELKCKDDTLNAKLYYKRAQLHHYHLG